MKPARAGWLHVRPHMDIRQSSIVSAIVAVSFFTATMHGAHAQNRPAVPKTEEVTFPGCEFVVRFPTKTQRKIAVVGGVESLMVQSVYDENSPFLRAECLPLDNLAETRRNLRSVLENQAQQSGVPNPQLTLQEDSRLGAIGTFSGIRKGGGFDIRVYGKTIVGQRSVLLLLTSELASVFPSDKAVIFLNTIERQ